MDPTPTSPASPAILSAKASASAEVPSDSRGTQEGPPPKPKRPLIMILAILIALLSLSVVGFFAYQNWKLEQQTAQITPTPSPTSSLTDLPAVALPRQQTDSAKEGVTAKEGTPDPTADWKTYINTSANYSIAYHPSWNIENIAAGSMGNTPPPESRYIQIYFQPQGSSKVASIDIEELQILPDSEGKTLNQEKTIGDSVAKCKQVKEESLQCWIRVPNKQIYLFMLLYKGKDEVYDKAIDQILSTFKFIDR